MNHYKYIFKSILLNTLLISLAACNSGSLNPTVLSDNNKKQPQFESPEHFIIGENVYLSFPDKNETTRISGGNLVVKSIQNTSSGNKPFDLTFADMVWLSGDFIGEPKVVIGDDKGIPLDDLEKNINAYDKYASYLPKVKKLVIQQLKEVNNNIGRKQRLEINQKYNREFACATGGGCNPITLLGSRGLYGNLAISNYDHFGKTAINAYTTGHMLAMTLASNAKTNEDLKNAYIFEGYSAHFLTDLFASGHVRVPREQLTSYCAYTPSAISSILAHDMHDEDGDQGLWLSDKEGNRWFAKGDKNLFVASDDENYKRVIAMLQFSVDQVYEAYKNRKTSDQIRSSMDNALKKLPDVDLINADPMNKPAMYKANAEGFVVKYNKSTNKYENIANCSYYAIGGVIQFFNELFGI